MDLTKKFVYGVSCVIHEQILLEGFMLTFFPAMDIKELVFADMIIS